VHVLLKSLIGLACASSVSATELKGVALGMAQSEVEALLAAEIGEWSCRAPLRQTPFVDIFCSKHTTFGGVPAKMFLLIYGDAVESITVSFASKDYGSVAAGLTSKFGQPVKSETVELQNRMGAKFESRNATWIFDDGTLSLRERATKVDQGAVALVSNAVLKRTPDGKSAASDM
jgi:hypothetical protein